MRKLLIVLFLGLLLVPSVFAGRKKDKAGKVTDYVFTDKKFNYSLTLNEGWKYKIQKNKSDFRLVLTKVKFAIPPEYTNTPDYTKIPRIAVFMAETKMSASAFIDSLVSYSYKSDTKKEILKEFEIFNIGSGSGFKAERLVPRKRKNFQLGELRGSQWTGQVKYTNEIAISASSTGGKRVKGGYGASVIGIKNGDKLLLFHIICEWNYFKDVTAETMKIINSLSWE